MSQIGSYEYFNLGKELVYIHKKYGRRSLSFKPDHSWDLINARLKRAPKYLKNHILENLLALWVYNEEVI